MACYMTVDIDCTGHACDMGRHSLNVQSQSGGLSAKALRSDTKLIDFLQHLFFQICVIGIRIRLLGIAHQCFLCQQRAFIKGTSDTYAYYHGRTWIRSCCLHGLQNKALDSLNSRSGLEHPDSAHIFAAEALGTYGYFDLLARNDLRIQHSRRIVAGIAAAHRILYNGFSKVPLVIATAYAFIYGFPQIAACDMYVLTNLQEYTGQTRILTDGYMLLSRNFKVFDNFV